MGAALAAALLMQSAGVGGGLVLPAPGQANSQECSGASCIPLGATAIMRGTASGCQLDVMAGIRAHLWGQPAVGTCRPKYGCPRD